MARGGPGKLALTKEERWKTAGLLRNMGSSPEDPEV